MSLSASLPSCSPLLLLCELTTLSLPFSDSGTTPNDYDSKVVRPHVAFTLSIAPLIRLTLKAQQYGRTINSLIIRYVLPPLYRIILTLGVP